MEKSRLPLFRKKTKSGGSTNNTSSKSTRGRDSSNQHATVTTDSSSSKHEQGQGGHQPVAVGNKGNKKAGKKDKAHHVTTAKTDPTGLGIKAAGVTSVYHDDPSKKWPHKQESPGQKQDVSKDGGGMTGKQPGQVGNGRVAQERGVPVESDYSTRTSGFDSTALYETNVRVSNSGDIRGSGPQTTTTTCTTIGNYGALIQREPSTDAIGSCSSFGPASHYHQHHHQPLASSQVADSYSYSSSSSFAAGYNNDDTTTTHAAAGDEDNSTVYSNHHSGFSASIGDDATTRRSGGGGPVVPSSYLDQFRKYYEYDVAGRRLVVDSEDSKSPSDPDSSPHHDYEDIDLVMSGGRQQQHHGNYHQHHQLESTAACSTTDQIRATNVYGVDYRKSRQSQGNLQQRPIPPTPGGEGHRQLPPTPKGVGGSNRGPLPAPPVPPHSSSASYYHPPPSSGEDGYYGRGGVAAINRLQPTSQPYIKTSQLLPTTTTTSSSHSISHTDKKTYSQPLVATTNQAADHSRSSTRTQHQNNTPRLGVYKHSVSVEGFVRKGSFSGQQTGSGYQLSGSQSGNALRSKGEDYEPLISTATNSGRLKPFSSPGMISRSSSAQTTGNIAPMTNAKGIKTYNTQGVEILSRGASGDNQVRSHGAQNQSNDYQHTYESVFNGYPSNHHVQAVNQNLQGEGLRSDSDHHVVSSLRSHSVDAYHTQEQSTPPDSPLDIVIPPPGASSSYFRTSKFSHFPYSHSSATDGVNVSSSQPHYHSNRYNTNSHVATLKDMVAVYNEKNNIGFEQQTHETRTYDQVAPPMDYYYGEEGGGKHALYYSPPPPSEYSSSVIGQYTTKEEIGPIPVGCERAPSYGYIYNTEISPRYLSEKELQTHQYHQQKYLGSGGSIYNTKQLDNTAGVGQTSSPPYTPILPGPKTSLLVGGGQSSPRTGVTQQGLYSLYSSPTGGGVGGGGGGSVGDRAPVTQSPLFGRKHSFPSPSCGIRMAEMRARAQRRWSDPKSPNYAAMAMDRSTPSPTGSTSSVHSYQSTVVEENMSTIREEDGCHGNNRKMATSPRSKKSDTSGYERLNPEDLLRTSGFPEKEKKLMNTNNQEVPLTADGTQICSSLKSPRKRHPSEPLTKKSSFAAPDDGSRSSRNSNPTISSRQYDSLQTVDSTHCTPPHPVVERLEAHNHNTNNKDCTEDLLLLVASDNPHQSQQRPDKAANVTTDDLAMPRECREAVETQCNQGENRGSIKPSNGLITQSFSEPIAVNKESSSSKASNLTLAGTTVTGSPTTNTTIKGDLLGEQNVVLLLQSGEDQSCYTCDTTEARVYEDRGRTKTVTPSSRSSSATASSLSECLGAVISTRGTHKGDLEEQQQNKGQGHNSNRQIVSSSISVGDGGVNTKEKDNNTVTEERDVSVSNQSPQITENSRSQQGGSMQLSSSPSASNRDDNKCSSVHHNSEEIITKRRSEGNCGNKEEEVVEASNIKATGVVNKSSGVSKLRLPSNVVHRHGGGGVVSVKTDQSGGKPALKSQPKEIKGSTSSSSSNNHQRPLLPVNTRKGEISNPSPSKTHGQRQGFNNSSSNTKEVNSAMKSGVVVQATATYKEQLKSGEENVGINKSTKTVAGATGKQTRGNVVVKHKGGGLGGIPNSKKTTNNKEDACQPSSYTNDYHNQHQTATGLPGNHKQENSSHSSGAAASNVAEINVAEEEEEALRVHRDNNSSSLKSSASEHDRTKSPLLKTSLTEAENNIDSSIALLGSRGGNKGVRSSLGKCHQRAASYSSISSCDPMSSLPSSPCSSQLSIDSISSDTFEYDLLPSSTKSTSTTGNVLNSCSKKRSESNIQNTSDSVSSSTPSLEQQYDLRNNTSNNVSLSEGCHSSNNKNRNNIESLSSKAIRHRMDHSNATGDVSLCKEASHTPLSCDNTDKSKLLYPSKVPSRKPQLKVSERRGSLSGIPTSKGLGLKGTSPKIGKRMTSSTSSESNVSSSSISGIAVRTSNHDNSRSRNRVNSDTQQAQGQTVHTSSPSRPRSKSSKSSQLKKPTAAVKTKIVRKNSGNGRADATEPQHEGMMTGKSLQQSPSAAVTTVGDLKKPSNSRHRNSSGSSNTTTGGSGMTVADYDQQNCKKGKTGGGLVSVSRSNSSESNASTTSTTTNHKTVKSVVKGELQSPTSPSDLNKTGSSLVVGFPRKATEMPTTSKLRAPKPSKLMKPVTTTAKIEQQSGLQPSKIAKSTIATTTAQSQAGHKSKVNTKTSAAEGPYYQESKDNSPNKIAGVSSEKSCSKDKYSAPIDSSSNSSITSSSSGQPRAEIRDSVLVTCSEDVENTSNDSKHVMTEIVGTYNTTSTSSSEKVKETRSNVAAEEIVSPVSYERMMTGTAITPGQCVGNGEGGERTSKPWVAVKGRSLGAAATATEAQVEDRMAAAADPNHLSGPKLGLDESGNPCPPTSSLVIETRLIGGDHKQQQEVSVVVVKKPSYGVTLDGSTTATTSPLLSYRTRTEVIDEEGTDLLQQCEQRSRNITDIPAPSKTQFTDKESPIESHFNGELATTTDNRLVSRVLLPKDGDLLQKEDEEADSIPNIDNKMARSSSSPNEPFLSREEMIPPVPPKKREGNNSNSERESGFLSRGERDLATSHNLSSIEGDHTAINGQQPDKESLGKNEIVSNNREELGNERHLKNSINKYEMVQKKGQVSFNGTEATEASVVITTTGTVADPALIGQLEGQCKRKDSEVTKNKSAGKVAEESTLLKSSSPILNKPQNPVHPFLVKPYASLRKNRSPEVTLTRGHGLPAFVRGESLQERQPENLSVVSNKTENPHEVTEEQVIKDNVNSSYSQETLNALSESVNERTTVKRRTLSPSNNNNSISGQKKEAPTIPFVAAADCVNSTNKLSRPPSTPQSLYPENTLLRTGPAGSRPLANHSQDINTTTSYHHSNVSLASLAPARQYTGSMATGSRSPSGSAEQTQVESDPVTPLVRVASSHTIKTKKEEGAGWASERSGGTRSETALYPKETEPTLLRCQHGEHDPARNCQFLPPKQIGSINETSSLGAVSINCDSNGDKAGPGAGSQEPDLIQEVWRGNQSRGQCNAKCRGSQGSSGSSGSSCTCVVNTRTANGDIATSTGKCKERKETKENYRIKNKSQQDNSGSKIVTCDDNNKGSLRDQLGNRNTECSLVENTRTQTAESYGSVVVVANTCEDKDLPCESKNKTKTLIAADQVGRSSSSGNNVCCPNNRIQSPAPCSSLGSPSKLCPHPHHGSSTAQEEWAEVTESSKEISSCDGPSLCTANGVPAKVRFRGKLKGCNVVAPEQRGPITSRPMPATMAARVSDDSLETSGWIRLDGSSVAKSGSPSSLKASGHKSPLQSSPENRQQICKKTGLGKLGKFNKIHSSSTNTESSPAATAVDKSIIGGNVMLTPCSSVQGMKHNTEALKRVVLTNTDDMCSEESQGVITINDETTQTSSLGSLSQLIPENALTPETKPSPVISHCDSKLSGEKSFKYGGDGFNGSQKANVQQYDSYFVLNDENSGRYMTFPSEPFSPKRKKRQVARGNEPFELKDQYIEDSYFGDPSITNDPLLFGPTAPNDPQSDPRERLSLGGGQNGDNSNMLNSLKLSESGYDSWKSQGSSSTACDPGSDNEVKGEGHQNLGQSQEDNHNEDSCSSCSSDTESINGMSTDSVVTMKTVRECCSETNSGSNDEDGGKVSMVTIDNCSNHLLHQCFEEENKRDLRCTNKQSNNSSLLQVECPSRCPKLLSASRSSSESTLTTDAIKYLEWDTSYDNSLLATHHKDTSSIEDLLESAELFSRGRDTSDSLEHLLHLDYEDFSDHNFDSGSMRKRLNFSGSDFALALHSMSKSPSEENVLDDCCSAAAILLHHQQQQQQYGKQSPLSCLNQGTPPHSSLLQGSGKTTGSGTIILSDDVNKSYGHTTTQPPALSSLPSSLSSSVSKVTQTCGKDTSEGSVKTSWGQEKKKNAYLGGHQQTGSEVDNTTATKWSGYKLHSSQCNSSRKTEKSPVGDKYKHPENQAWSSNTTDATTTTDLIAHPSTTHHQAEEGNPRLSPRQRCENGGGDVKKDKSVSQRGGEILMGEVMSNSGGRGGNVHEESGNYYNSGREAAAGLSLLRDLESSGLTPGQLDHQSGDNSPSGLRNNRLTAVVNEKLPEVATTTMIDREVDANRSMHCVDRSEIAIGTNAQSEITDSHYMQAQKRVVAATFPQSILNREQQPHSSNSNIKARAAPFESGVTFLNERRKQLFLSRHSDQHNRTSPLRNVDLSSNPPNLYNNNNKDTRAMTTGAQQPYLVVRTNTKQEEVSPVETQLSPAVGGRESSGNGEEIEGNVQNDRVRRGENRKTVKGEDNNSTNRRFSAGLLSYRDRLLQFKGAGKESTSKTRSKSHGDEPSGKQTVPSSGVKLVVGQGETKKLGQINEETRSSDGCSEWLNNNPHNIPGESLLEGNSSIRHSKGVEYSQSLKDSKMTSDKDNNALTDRPKSLNIPTRFSSGSSDLKIATALFMEASPPDEVFEPEVQPRHQGDSKNTPKLQRNCDYYTEEEREELSILDTSPYASNQSTGVQDTSPYASNQSTGVQDTSPYGRNQPAVLVRQQSHEEYLKSRRQSGRLVQSFPSSVSTSRSPVFNSYNNTGRSQETMAMTMTTTTTTSDDSNLIATAAVLSPSQMNPVFELQNGTLVSRHRPKSSDQGLVAARKTSQPVDAGYYREEGQQVQQREDGNQPIRESQAEHQPKPNYETMATASVSSESGQGMRSRFTTSQIPWGQKRGSGVKVMEKLKLFQGQHKSPEGHKFSWSQLKVKKVSQSISQDFLEKTTAQYLTNKCVEENNSSAMAVDDLAF